MSGVVYRWHRESISRACMEGESDEAEDWPSAWRTVMLEERPFALLEDRPFGKLRTGREALSDPDSAESVFIPTLSVCFGQF